MSGKKAKSARRLVFAATLDRCRCRSSALRMPLACPEHLAVKQQVGLGSRYRYPRDRISPGLRCFARSTGALHRPVERRRDGDVSIQLLGLCYEVVGRSPHAGPRTCAHSHSHGSGVWELNVRQPFLIVLTRSQHASGLS